MTFSSIILLVILVLVGFMFGYLLGRIKRCEGACGIEEHSK